MKEKTTRAKSLTDWKRLDAMTDSEIDTSDIPQLPEDFFKSAELRLPEGKTLVTIRLDSDIVRWLKAGGKGYQTRINAILRTYKDAMST
jgi:uncharacterized protein (DUF4415 family)